jgi:hypothetical protein
VVVAAAVVGGAALVTTTGRRVVVDEVVVSTTSGLTDVVVDVDGTVELTAARGKVDEHPAMISPTASQHHDTTLRFAS